MRERTWKTLASCALISGCLALMACGNSTPAPPTPEPDGGTQPPDGGTQPPDGGTQPPDGGTVEPACSVTAPTSCPEPAPRYSDVEPIFQQRCLICHNGNSGPWPLTDYGHVSDWQDTIRANVLDCTMPPPEAQVPITVQERTAILTWIRCGLPQ